MKKFLSNPYLNLLLGIIVIISGLSEAVNALESGFSLSTHHGVIVLGFIHIIKTLPEIVEGFKKVSEESE